MTGNTQIAAALRRTLPYAEFLALFLLLALFVLKALIPAWNSLRSDFANYYIVARLLREHYSMDRIYDWIWLQRVKDHWSIPQPLVGFVGLTPFSALPLLPLTWLDALEAKRVWLVVNLALLAATLYGMQRITSLSARRVALIAFLAIIPLRNDFLLGQMHLVVLALLVLAFWFDGRKKWLQCSVVLALAASLKIYPLLFIAYFLRKRQWKPAAVLAGSTLAILAACFLVFGTPAMRAFLVEQFPRMLRGEATDPFSLSAPSASSLFHRVFLLQPHVNPHPVLPSPLLYAMLYPLWQLSLLAATLLMVSPKDLDPRRKSLEWAAWICLLLALSTEPASYHRVILILVVVLAVYAIQGAWRRAILFGCYFIVCNVHPAVTAQHPMMALLIDFVPYWTVVALLACLLARLRTRRFERSSSSLPLPQWPRWRMAWTLAGFAVVWAVGSTTTFVHARALSGSAYLTDRTGTAFARFDPHVSGNHLLTVSMLLEGFRAEDQNGVRYRTAESGIEDDQLAIASSENSNRIWIEAANGGQSRLVELELLPGKTAPAPIATIFDAESPTLSPDGRSLVFLRETRGAGRAWKIRIDENGRLLSAPVPVSPAEMDVRDAEFSAPDTILFSAAENGVPHLFVMRDGAVRRIFSTAYAMERPTSYAESSVLVRQQKKDGYWRLYGSNPAREAEAQLTFGDCNAYDPAWLDATRLVYVSDCGRGAGMGALAEINIGMDTGKRDGAAADAARISRAQGESQE
jgi:hypothetical protein